MLLLAAVLINNEASGVKGISLISSSSSVSLGGSGGVDFARVMDGAGTAPNKSSAVVARGGGGLNPCITADP